MIYLMRPSAATKEMRLREAGSSASVNRHTSPQIAHKSWRKNLTTLVWVGVALVPAVLTVGAYPASAADGFNWRKCSREVAAGEAASFTLSHPPVRGGTVRRPEGEFGALRHGGASYHKGLDFLAPRGTPVHAPHSGVIVYNELNGGPTRGYGYTVIIDHGNNFYTLYAHLLGKSPLPVGNRVEAGERIGRVGRSGNASRVAREYQYQLHFEIIHAPSGLINLNGIKITEWFTQKRITLLRELGEAVYGIYWGGVLDPEEFVKL